MAILSALHGAGHADKKDSKTNRNKHPDKLRLAA